MEPTEQNDAPATTSSSGLLRRNGLKLAFTAPAVLAALHAGVAAADDDDHDDDDHDDHQSGSHQRPVRAAATLPLSRANDVNANAGGDFNSSGGDSLSSGRVLVGPRNGNTDVSVTVNGGPGQHDVHAAVQTLSGP